MVWGVAGQLERIKENLVESFHRHFRLVWHPALASPDKPALAGQVDLSGAKAARDSKTGSLKPGVPAIT